LLDQRRDKAFGILVRNLDQHHVARMALDKRCYITIPRSTDQVALPMAWHRTIFNRRRSLADGYGILDLAEPVSGWRAWIGGPCASPSGAQEAPFSARRAPE
jgi:hypothetical protein